MPRASLPSTIPGGLRIGRNHPAGSEAPEVIDADDVDQLECSLDALLPPSEIILRHAWPASLRPICAVYGLVIGALLSGSFVVEYVTGWPGLGWLMYEALRARDIYLVAGCAAMGAFLLALGTLLGDLLLVAADPRAREDAA